MDRLLPIPGAPVFPWTCRGVRYLLTANLAFAVALSQGDADASLRDADALRAAGLTHCPGVPWDVVVAHASNADIEGLRAVFHQLVNALLEDTQDGNGESSWLDVWATARYDYGLPEAEVWALTIPEFKALAVRAEARQEGQDRQTARLMAMLYNINRAQTSPPRKEEDFMPIRRAPAVKQVKATWSEIDSVFRALGGR